MRLTENGNARSKQLLMMLTQQLTDREWLPLNGSEGLASFLVYTIAKTKIYSF